MKRIVATPLKVCGFLTIVLGLSSTILTLGYLILLGLCITGIGLLLYLVDFLLKISITKKRVFRISQISITVIYVLFYVGPI